MTETARLADYILPAHTQFEKWEFTGFNLEFPKNGFHLRHPVLAAQTNTLPEAEIYTRLLEAMQVIPKRFPILEKIAAVDSKKQPIYLTCRHWDLLLHDTKIYSFCSFNYLSYFR